MGSLVPCSYVNCTNEPVWLGLCAQHAAEFRSRPAYIDAIEYTKAKSARERANRWRKEFRDQGAHLAYLIWTLLPIIFNWWLIFGCWWIGFHLGLLREMTEEGKVSFKAFRNSMGLDLLVWSWGGALIGLALELAR